MASAPRANCTPLSLFVRKRKEEITAKGGGPAVASLVALQAEWKALPPEEREAFEGEARALRAAGSGDATAEFLKRQQQEQLVIQDVKKIDAREGWLGKPDSKKQRKAAATDHTDAPKSRSGRRRPEVAQIAEIPRPVFPVSRPPLASQPNAPNVAGEGDLVHAVSHQAVRAERRREKTSMLRAQAESSEARLATVSSSGIDLAETAARLCGPVLSCDWRQDDSSGDEADNLLEVDMPKDRFSSAALARRGMLHQELQRKISSERVLGLTADRRPALQNHGCENGVSPTTAISGCVDAEVRGDNAPEEPSRTAMP